jgi:predicted TIM-barrel fold metal-dependent hydrolase
LAEELDIPFAVHTAEDENSKVKYLYETAKENPKVNFIAVHMGLGTDNQEAIEYISKLDNLYGDTTWVSKENVLEAVKKCGSKKIMFGTDAIIDGTNTYEKYLTMFEYLHENLSEEDFENVFRYNARRLFDL